jgi:hypothetical protein
MMYHWGSAGIIREDFVEVPDLRLSLRKFTSLLTCRDVRR